MGASACYPDWLAFAQIKSATSRIRPFGQTKLAFLILKPNHILKPNLILKSASILKPTQGHVSPAPTSIQ